MKFILSFFTSLLLAGLLGVGIAEAATVSGLPVSSIDTTSVVFIGRTIGLHVLNVKGIAGAGVNKEIWLSQILENFYRMSDFLDGVDDWSAFVEYNTLNFAAAGGDPSVLVNNTTYPIVAAGRTDVAKTISLDTYDTVTTRVRNIEEMEAAYDKLESVVKQHRNALRQECHDRAIHAFAPASDAADSPVLLTSGTAGRAIDGLTGAFNKFTTKDIARMQKKFDLESFPQEGRVLVLHPEHVEDLLEENTSLFKLIAELQSGKIIDLFGFKVKKYAKNPVYTESTGAKVAYGAAAAPTTDTISSVAFCETEVVKAVGDVEMFYKNKEINPEQRADEVGFQKRFVALPKRDVAIGTIISDRN